MPFSSSTLTVFELPRAFLCRSDMRQCGAHGVLLEMRSACQYNPTNSAWDTILAQYLPIAILVSSSNHLLDISAAAQAELQVLCAQEAIICERNSDTEVSRLPPGEVFLSVAGRW
jgi:hypothetical protein